MKCDKIFTEKFRRLAVKLTFRCYELLRFEAIKKLAVEKRMRKRRKTSENPRENRLGSVYRTCYFVALRTHSAQLTELTKGSTKANS